MKRNLILITSIVFMLSCENNRYGKNVSCEDMFKNLLISSGYSTPLVSESGTNGTVPWDTVRLKIEKDQMNYLIQLFFVNEDKRDVSIAWLEFFPDDNIILDVSIDELHPDTLYISQNLSDLWKNGCFP